ncbi:MAG: hypothetical protein K8T20_11575 [Planctomycetes bacterium]|nr:hypothetical protein [Planctomycetota bacterium]
MVGDPVRPLITPSATPVGGAGHIHDTSGMLAMFAAAMGAKPKAKPGDDVVVRRPDLIPIPPAVMNLNQAFPLQQKQFRQNIVAPPNQATAQGSAPLPNGVQGAMIAMQQSHPLIGTMLAMQQDPPMIGTIPIIGYLADPQQGDRPSLGDNISNFLMAFLPPCNDPSLLPQASALLVLMRHDNPNIREMATDELQRLYLMCPEVIGPLLRGEINTPDPEHRIRIESILNRQSRWEKCQQQRTNVWSTYDSFIEETPWGRGRRATEKRKALLSQLREALEGSTSTGLCLDSEELELFSGLLEGLNADPDNQEAALDAIDKLGRFADRGGRK